LKNFWQELEIFGMLVAYDLIAVIPEFSLKYVLIFYTQLRLTAEKAHVPGDFFVFSYRIQSGPTLTARPYDDIALAISCSP
jgi:hypothetical protein